jgi:hypothetical protein
MTFRAAHARRATADAIEAAAAAMTTQLRGLAGTTEHAELLADCLTRLDLFRLSRQLDVLDELLDTRPTRGDGRVMTGLPSPRSATLEKLRRRLLPSPA